MEREIEIINKIIRESVIHGADSGGSYDQNEKKLLESINEWIEFKDVSEEYVAMYTKVDCRAKGTWEIIQIVRR